MEPFEQVVRDHGAVVWRVCAAIVGRSDADDAWSDTFLSALRAYPDLDSGREVRPWLLTIARHRSIDLLRRLRADSVPPTDARLDLAVEADPSAELDVTLTRSLAHLGERQRTAVALRYLADQSYAHIAEVLECTEAAARRNAADGIAHLRRSITQGAPS
jgi:RNA polymerase sigma factor (sigma-70 family)